MLESLAERFRDIQLRIERAAMGRPVPVLIAASKSQSIESIEALYQLGQRDFGENYVQELCEKAEALSQRGCSEIRWHMIGHLQRNKVKKVLPWIQWVHSVDSARLAETLSQEAIGLPRKISVLIEVNVDGESSKAGIAPSETVELAKKIEELPGLTLEGLMCIPLPGSGDASYRQLAELEQQCRPHTKGALSMGMSDDFELAIRAGATHVRVGTALFGPRPRA